MSKRIRDFEYYRAWSFAEFGGKKITAGDSSEAGDAFIAIKAVGGDITVNITANVGDDLPAHPITKDDVFVYPIASFDVDAGSAGYAVGYLADQ